MAVPVQALLKHCPIVCLLPIRCCNTPTMPFVDCLNKTARPIPSWQNLRNFSITIVMRILPGWERYQHFSQAVLAMVESLEQMNPTEANSLRQYFTKFDFYIRFLLLHLNNLPSPPML